MSESRSSTPKELSATYDRGPAKYFHGREDVFEKFDQLSRKSKQVKGGSIFIIQGAPGVGKTALLYECEKRAEKDGWRVAKIKSGALWDKEKMLRSLGLGKWAGIDSVSLSLLEIFEAGISFSKPARSTISLNAVKKRKKQPLLLILDEAQKLASASDQSNERREDAKELLEAIHNGELNKPVILLAAGLGGTEATFERLGISRISQGCFIALSHLEKEAEHAVIRDFLVKDGGTKGDPSVWIESIANKTHGWPQHIVSYGHAASELLQESNGTMTPEILEKVYEVGDELREDYYQRRARGLLREHRICLAKIIESTPLEHPVNHNLIKASLKKEFGPSEAKKLFQNIQRKGILDERHGEYFIPIPSMHTWLVENYARGKEQLTQSAGYRHGLDSIAKTLGMPRETIDAQLPPPEIRVETNPSVSSKEQERNLPDRSQGWE